MIDFEKNDIFDSFRLTLAQAKLIKFGEEDRIIILDKRQFLEFGFGLYLLWINVHKRIGTPFLYFTGVGTDQTLFLVSPYQDNPFFCRPKGYRPGHFYLDTLEESFETDHDNCQFCELRNSILFNISYFRHTDAFQDFLKEQEKHIRGDFPKKKDCSKCKPMYLAWLIKRIREDDRFGLCLGGYAALLEIPSRVFELLLKEPREGEGIGKETGMLFDSFLTTYLAEKFQSTKYVSNAVITSPFASRSDIDCLIVIEKDSTTNLLAIETTSYHHELRGLKAKLLNYSALSRGGFNKFMYIYLTLTHTPSVKFAKKEIRELTEKDKDLGSLTSIMTHGGDFEYLNLPTAYKDLDTNLKIDWWDRKYLRDSYNYVIETIEDRADQLRIP
jgi:hypothetical protein